MLKNLSIMLSYTDNTLWLYHVISWDNEHVTRGWPLKRETCKKQYFVNRVWVSVEKCKSGQQKRSMSLLAACQYFLLSEGKNHVELVKVCKEMLLSRCFWLVEKIWLPVSCLLMWNIDHKPLQLLYLYYCFSFRQ